MNTSSIVYELEQCANQPGATPATLRKEVHKKLNGSTTGHPLLIHSHKGPAMRIETCDAGNLLVSVPDAWMELEP